MSTPPNTPPGAYYGAPPPQPPKSNSSGCWKAGGITCGVLLLLIIIGGFLAYNTAMKFVGGKSGFMSTVKKMVQAQQDGKQIQQAVVSYHSKNGKYPNTLTDLVPDYLTDGKILHESLDPDSTSPGHISWKYDKPTEGEPGTTPLLEMPYQMTFPGQNSQFTMPKQTLIITLDGLPVRPKSTAVPSYGS